MYNSTFLPKPYLNEEDIRSFLQEAVDKKANFRKSVAIFSLLLLAGFGGFILLNLNSFLRLESTPSTITKAVDPAPTPLSTAAATPTPPPPTTPLNVVSAPDLNISVPTHWDTPLQEKVIQEKLKTGVTHIKGTAKPGEKGMVVITGHSSNYPWAAGSYNSIFAPLHKAVPGHEIVINYNNVGYTYRVTRTYVIKPTQLEVLEDGSKTGIRLVTCTPLGTSINRLVVEAEQISPNPANNTSFTHANFGGGSIPNAQ